MRWPETILSLNDDELLAMSRFRSIHAETNEGNQDVIHDLSWSLCDDVSESVSLCCKCGATLHLGETIYVEVEPKKFAWGDRALLKAIAEQMRKLASLPKVYMYNFSVTGFFNYVSGIADVYELANKEGFPSDLRRPLCRGFIKRVLGDVSVGRETLGEAVEVAGGDEKAFPILLETLDDVIDDMAPDLDGIDVSERDRKLREWGLNCTRDAATESLYQSALVTLPEDTFEQIRLHPSRGDMHFGLGLYLRNRFIHSGLLWCGIDPDRQSGRAIERLIEHCLPELSSMPLVYEWLGSGLLYKVYKFCMSARGEMPIEQIRKRYGILQEAETLEDANPYSILDREHNDEWHEWQSKVHEKRREFSYAVAREVWDFNSLRKILPNDAITRTESLCEEAACGGHPVFIPSEIAYFLQEEVAVPDEAYAALSWAAEERDVKDLLPGEVFHDRLAVLSMVRKDGALIELAEVYNDDDEVVQLAVERTPEAIKFASPRLQSNREIQRIAAGNAKFGTIFRDRPMASVNDDDELVSLTLRANGANIAYASDRIRDDSELGLLAVQNRRDFCPDDSYASLSERVKRDRRVVETVAREWDSLPSIFPPVEYADDDNLAAILAERGDHYRLLGLSRRIKEQYMTEDELEKWGDEPWWRGGDNTGLSLKDSFARSRTEWK